MAIVHDYFAQGFESCHFRILALVLALFVVYRYLNDPLRDVPGPWLARCTRLWLWYHYRRRQFHKDNIELHKAYGPIVRIAPNEYSIDDPEAVRIIYGHGTKFIKGPWYLATGPPSQRKGAVVNIFSDRDPVRHGESRRKVANEYALSALKDSEQYIESTVAVLLDKFEQFADAQTVFDLGLWLQFFAFDVVGEITFGKRFGFINEAKDVDNMIHTLEASLRDTAPFGVFYELHRPFRMLQGWWARYSKSPPARSAIAAFTQEQMRTWQDTNEFYRGDFLSRFMEMHRRTPEKLSKDEIFQVCLTQITAGSDTTAISLRAVLYYLYRNPDKLEILREEISKTKVEEGLVEHITYQHTLHMPYLQAVLKEALRLHPATGFTLGRVVPSGGSTISGRFFPAGTVVGINSWTAHHNRQVFGSDTEAFRPERWLCSDQEYADMDQYFMAVSFSHVQSVVQSCCRSKWFTWTVPLTHWTKFGKGSRTCIGKNLAMMELAKLVPVIVGKYDIVFQNKQWSHENMWFVKQNGLQCQLVKREDSSI